MGIRRLTQGFDTEKMDFEYPVPSEPDQIIAFLKSP